MQTSKQKLQHLSEESRLKLKTFDHSTPRDDDIGDDLLEKYKNVIFDIFVEETELYEVFRNASEYLSLACLLVIPIGAAVYLRKELKRRRQLQLSAKNPSTNPHQKRKKTKLDKYCRQAISKSILARFLPTLGHMLFTASLFVIDLSLERIQRRVQSTGLIEEDFSCALGRGKNPPRYVTVISTQQCLPEPIASGRLAVLPVVIPLYLLVIVALILQQSSLAVRPKIVAYYYSSH